MLALATRMAFRSVLSTFTGAPEIEERRASARRQAALTAEVVSGGRVFPAKILNISTGGLELVFAAPPALFRGAQLLVRAAGFAPITGAVCWIAGPECGMAFNVALAEDMLADQAVLFDPGKRARPGRARIKLSAMARAPGFERKVLIENIGVGGAQISSGLSFPAPVGQGMMLEVNGLLPIGGYVRWSRQGRVRLMFTKLLPLATAEEIAARCGIHASWLADVRAAHAALNEASTTTE